MQQIKSGETLEVVAAETIPTCGLIVRFSDGTWAHYATEELASLRPHREPSGLHNAD